MPEWVNTLLRSAGLFFLALLLVRLIGKRLTARMTFFDLVTAIVIGVLAAAVSLNLAGPVNGIAALAVWTAFPALIYLLAIKYKAVRDIVQGAETVLINHGKVLEDKLLEARLTPEDLLSQLRKKDVFNFADVEFAVLEPTGEVSALLKKDRQPVTAKTLGLEVGRESVPQTVMLDGLIMDEPLTAMGLNRRWLHTELEKAGVAPENVFIAQVDSVGQLYLDLFDDAVLLPKPKTKELAHATLKKCQADCEIYALGTKQPEAKKMYGESAGILAEAIKELEPLLKR
ncbi:MAG: YetF domain-containing protein [Eubacteriales bacterium]